MSVSLWFILIRPLMNLGRCHTRAHCVPICTSFQLKRPGSGGCLVFLNRSHILLNSPCFHSIWLCHWHRFIRVYIEDNNRIIISIILFDIHDPLATFAENPQFQMMSAVKAVSVLCDIARILMLFWFVSPGSKGTAAAGCVRRCMRVRWHQLGARQFA